MYMKTFGVLVCFSFSLVDFVLLGLVDRLILYWKKQMHQSKTGKVEFQNSRHITVNTQHIE